MSPRHSSGKSNLFASDASEKPAQSSLVEKNILVVDQSPSTTESQIIPEPLTERVSEDQPLIASSTSSSIASTAATSLSSSPTTQSVTISSPSTKSVVVTHTRESEQPILSVRPHLPVMEVEVESEADSTLQLHQPHLLKVEFTADTYAAMKRRHSVDGHYNVKTESDSLTSMPTSTSTSTSSTASPSMAQSPPKYLKYNFTPALTHTLETHTHTSTQTSTPTQTHALTHTYEKPKLKPIAPPRVPIRGKSVDLEQMQALALSIALAQASNLDRASPTTLAHSSFNTSQVQSPSSTQPLRVHVETPDHIEESNSTPNTLTHQPSVDQLELERVPLLRERVSTADYRLPTITRRCSLSHIHHHSNGNNGNQYTHPTTVSHHQMHTANVHSTDSSFSNTPLMASVPCSPIIARSRSGSRSALDIVDGIYMSRHNSQPNDSSQPIPVPISHTANPALQQAMMSTSPIYVNGSLKLSNSLQSTASPSLFAASRLRPYNRYFNCQSPPVAQTPKEALSPKANSSSQASAASPPPQSIQLNNIMYLRHLYIQQLNKKKSNSGSNAVSPTQASPFPTTFLGRSTSHSNHLNNGQGPDEQNMNGNLSNMLVYDDDVKSTDSTPFPQDTPTQRLPDPLSISRSSTDPTADPAELAAAFIVRRHSITGSVHTLTHPDPYINNYSTIHEQAAAEAAAAAAAAAAETTANLDHSSMHSIRSTSATPPAAHIGPLSPTSSSATTQNASQVVLGVAHPIVRDHVQPVLQQTRSNRRSVRNSSPLAPLAPLSPLSPSPRMSSPTLESSVATAPVSDHASPTSSTQTRAINVLHRVGSADVLPSPTHRRSQSHTQLKSLDSHNSVN